MSCACVHLAIAVLKSQVVPEYEAIEALEESIALAYSTDWLERADAAIAHVVDDIEGKRVVSAEDVAGAVETVDAWYVGWPSSETAQAATEGIAEVYKLSQTVVVNKVANTKGYDKDLVFKAKLEPSFDATDDDAIAWLQGQQVYWAKEHYDTATRAAIEGAALEAVEGLSGPEAAKILKSKLAKALGAGTFSGATDSYFRMVTTSAATTARNSGAIFAMDKLDVDKYVINNPRDERTTPICAALDGKEFPVTKQVERLKEIMAATDPEAVKALHPWNPATFQQDFEALGVSVQADKALAPGAAEVLADAGYGMPPYHGRCRTTVDIA